ncbi:MAG: hypothetical protein KF830_05925 [Planctomycetes bacterium]|nr:hypothetical protein [Planctomycetota bacterium]
MVGNSRAQTGPSLLERIDLALASRMVPDGAESEPLAVAQRVLDGVRRPMPEDPAFAAAVLRLRGFAVDDQDAVDVLHDRPSRLSSITQEHRLLRGLDDCLRLLRERAAAGASPDGPFLLELFRTMAARLPRFRNNDLRRGPPWDSHLHVQHPPAEQLRGLLETFDDGHCYRDVPVVFRALHPVRQGFRLLWRCARIAPFPDFNVVMAWLAMNAWLQAKGYPLLPPAQGDRELLLRLVGGPPPTKLVPFEARLLRKVENQD